MDYFTQQDKFVADMVKAYKTGKLGVGHCTRNFECHVDGCPPTEQQIYEFLKNYLSESN